MGDFNVIELTKKTPITIALFVVGAFFVLLGLSGAVSIGGNNLLLQEDWARISALVFGMICVLIALVSSFLVYKRELEQVAVNEKPQKSSQAATRISRAKAESVFFTLDEMSPVETFPNMIKNATRIDILSRTAINLLNQYQREFERLSKAGCEIRILFTDPSSVAAQFLYGSSSKLYQSNITNACRIIENLKEVSGNKIQVRVTQYAPTISVITIQEKEEKVTRCFLQVTLYFLHSAVGRDRPVFRIEQDDRWFDIFEEEFSQMWNRSIEWDVTKFLSDEN